MGNSLLLFVNILFMWKGSQWKVPLPTFTILLQYRSVMVKSSALSRTSEGSGRQQKIFTTPQCKHSRNSVNNEAVFWVFGKEVFRLSDDYITWDGNTSCPLLADGLSNDPAIGGLVIS